MSVIFQPLQFQPQQLAGKVITESLLSITRIIQNQSINQPINHYYILTLISQNQSTDRSIIQSISTTDNPDKVQIVCQPTNQYINRPINYSTSCGGGSIVNLAPCRPLPPPDQTALQVAELNVKCVKRAQENGERSSKTAMNNAIDGQGNTPVAKVCCGGSAQVHVRQVEGLDELSWGELEGQEFAQEPWKERLATLKAAWDAGHYDRYNININMHC